MNNLGEMLFDTDLDGTLFFKSKGSLFTFITGRVPQNLGKYLRADPLERALRMHQRRRHLSIRTRKNICFSRF